MPKLKLPDTATVLWRWMERHSVTVAELARALDVTPNYLGDVRRGLYKPSDELKLKIETATRRIEAANGVKRVRGVVPGDWFPTANSSQRSPTSAKRRTSATS